VFFEFAYLYSNIVRKKTRVKNAEFLAEQFEPKSKRKQIDLKKGWKKLEVKDLSFSYHSEAGADLHLDHINLEIKKGQKIALVGESGSGKTTTLKILRELYTPNSENVFLDGKELLDGLRSISSHISLIPQDPEIFNSTILENITFSIPYSMEVVEKYIQLAEFSDVIARLPNGLQSLIVEKGVNLSGGEKQRLALVRGLLASKNKEIVLLDEPTSSVDSGNELKIFHNIFEEFKNKAVIASVHRLHLLPLFDSIYLFNNGQIFASGTFSELLSNSEEFASMWQKYQVTQKTQNK
jgi:ABC-type multidrug transport system fused ATPase/permease subunit